MTRDLTRKQLAAAFKRHSFKVRLLWIVCDRHPGSHVGVVCRPNGKLRRRATLAKAIKLFEAEDAKAEHHP